MYRFNQIRSFCFVVSALLLLHGLEAYAARITVNGQVAGAKPLSGNYAHLLLFKGSSGPSEFFSSPVKNNQFEIVFSKDRIDTLIYARLIISSHPTMDKKMYVEHIRDLTLHNFFIDTTAIRITVNHQSGRALVQGGEFNRQKRAYDLIDSTYAAIGSHQKIESPYHRTGDFITDRNLYRIIAYLEVAKQYPSSALSVRNIAVFVDTHIPWYYLTHHSQHNFLRQEIKEALANLSPACQATDEVKSLYVKLDEKVIQSAPKKGFVPEGILLTNITQQKFPIADLFGDKEFLLLDFWTTWCGPCIKQHPAIQLLSEQLKETNIKVIGVSFDKEFKSWQKYLIKYPNYKFPQFWVEESDKNVWEDIGIVKFPTYTLVEKSTGKVVEQDILFTNLEQTLAKYTK